MKELQDELLLIIEMLRELIFKINDVSHFSKEDKDQLKYLKEVLGLLVKVQPLVIIPEEKISPEDDDEILRRFLERSLKELPETT